MAPSCPRCGGTCVEDADGETVACPDCTPARRGDRIPCAEPRELAPCERGTWGPPRPRASALLRALLLTASVGLGGMPRGGP
jgi:hypothetical protein